MEESCNESCVEELGDDDLGRTLKFKVNNPLDKKAEIYVKYGKSVFGHAFMDPKCEAFEGPVGCNVDAVEIDERTARARASGHVP